MKILMSCGIRKMPKLVNGKKVPCGGIGSPKKWISVRIIFEI